MTAEKVHRGVKKIFFKLKMYSCITTLAIYCRINTTSKLLAKKSTLFNLKGVKELKPTYLITNCLELINDR